MPQPLTIAEQEQMSRLMLDYQEKARAAAEMRATIAEAQLALPEQEKARDVALAEIQKQIAAFQESHGAKGCRLGNDKQWKQCPAAPASTPIK